MITQSEEVAELYAALTKASAEMSPPEKDAVNPRFQSRYSTLAQLKDATREPLRANGLHCLQLVHTDAEGDYHCVSRLLHTSGQWLEFTVLLAHDKRNPQDLGTWWTYMRRYSLASLLGVEGEPDTDGEPPPQPERQQQQQQQRKQQQQQRKQQPRRSNREQLTGEQHRQQQQQQHREQHRGAPRAKPEPWDTARLMSRLDAATDRQALYAVCDDAKEAGVKEDKEASQVFGAAVDAKVAALKEAGAWTEAAAQG